ncbi:preATP grasp domain-containing protein [Planobispora takensis]|uniref:ATP-grasp domain-containing protein n=1 Tax=Planobispora takensis TaxID=1367882 RepID=A0A8J3ST20_9ACTN|nr:peptide ligase PGM1-related protein [Planobispora takensis]GIH98200.1 hypothetical protein Pta02_02090 [Planobispora takensis]
MATLIISNCTEEIVGDLAELSDEMKKAFGWGAQRLLWYAQEGDVVILPAEPDPAFLGYVVATTGVPASSLSILVPPPGVLGGDLLSPDRLADEGFREELRKVAAERTIDGVIACYADISIPELVTSVGIDGALPGCAFIAEGGNVLVNSKAVFRAVAAGAGIPIAPGVVTGNRHHAERTINGLLGDGYDVMVKREFGGGGFGNEILSPAPGVQAAGAPNVVVLPDEAAVAGYLEERWEWLTGGKGDRLVIERFFPGSVTVYAEFDATGDGCELRGSGEIMMDPIAVGEIVPPVSVSPQALATLVEEGRRLCDLFRLMGYRGNICADAILTRDGQIVFTETNGRLTASTHLHVNVARRIVGEEHRDERVLLERGRVLKGTSFPEALERLYASGLAYDPDTRLGVLFTGDYVPINGNITYTIVARGVESARDIERRLRLLSADAAA